MWEKGTRVKIIGGAKIGLMGTVVVKRTENPINDIRDRFLVEFDESMGGHSGNGAYKGKRGHCVMYCFRPTQWDKYFRKIQSKRKNNYY